MNLLISCIRKSMLRYMCAFIHDLGNKKNLELVMIHVLE